MTEKTEKSEFPARWFDSRRLTMRGLKPSDYFLYKQQKDYFNFDMRQLVVLGLRWIYAGLHEERMRDMILNLASQINQEDLDYEKNRPEYLEMDKLMRLK